MMLQAAISDIRTGQGIDVHAFGPGDHVMLGGVSIPHDRGLTGHSDADVVLQLRSTPFSARWPKATSAPTSRPAIRNGAARRPTDSCALRSSASRRAGARSRISMLSIICEAPRIGPHRDAMRARIAEIAGIAADRVAVKATTSEGLGFTGRGEGIAAFATATIRLPAERLEPP